MRRPHELSVSQRSDARGENMSKVRVESLRTSVAVGIVAAAHAFSVYAIATPPVLANTGWLLGGLTVNKGVNAIRLCLFAAL
jgi:hypothetical protein